MGAFYVLHYKDADKHNIQASEIALAEEAGRNCNVTYCNALYCGVYPCFISEAADVDTTCFAAAWPDESFELMQQAGGLINRALLSYHRGISPCWAVKVVSDTIHVYFKHKGNEPQWEVFSPLMPILNWEPAKGGSDALAALQPLFPPAPPAPPEG